MPVHAILRTASGRWLRLAQPHAVLEARSAADVVPVLRQAERAAADGAYVAGFVAYEAAAAFGLAVHPPDGDGLPLAWFAAFAGSHVQDVAGPSAPAPAAAGPVRWTPSIDRDGYLAAVTRIRESIADGDTYQLNYTFRMTTPFEGDAWTLFEQLTAAQRGPWSAFLDLGRHAICSASPELFFAADGRRIVCRPMKGTLPRGLTLDADRRQAAELQQSAKNRSENVMIVDLMRNDLGRVARVGSVTVSSLYDVERYPAQWQMTSTIEAELARPGLTEVFAALFPSGSITGAPKARSMEILRALEPSPRGVYTGAIGVIEPGGHAHFNVAIRTVVIDRERRRAAFGVGSGIVWESDAAEEFEECRVKASILTAAPPRFELLETLRWQPGGLAEREAGFSPAEAIGSEGGYALLDRHLTRARESAEYFGFPFDEDAVRLALHDAVAGQTETARVRLLIDAAGRVRCETAVLTGRATPLRAALAASPIARQDVFLYHKTTNRAVHEAARASRPDADAVLLWNEDGEITEGTDANLVVELDGRRVTPPVDCGLLAGTLRAELLARGEIVERRLTRADLARASRVWLINSVRGWMEVTPVDQRVPM